jgi:hypothetical protein
MGNSPGNGLLEQSPIADWPSGPTMALPLSWHDQGRPTQLLGSATNGGISAAGTAMEEQMRQPAAGARPDHDRPRPRSQASGTGPLRAHKEYKDPLISCQR